MKKILVLFFVVIPLFAVGQIEVNMEKQLSGTYLVPCKVNGVPLKFIFDTGASVVNISMTEALFLIKNGYVNLSDIKGTTYSQIANGEIVENTEIVLRSIEIGGIEIKNIVATVSHNMKAPLLLGQSAIQKLGPIQLEGNKLIILNGQEYSSDEKALKFYKKSFQEIESEKYNEAIQSSEAGLKLTKNSTIRGNLYDNMSNAYFKLQLYDEAIDCCNKGLSEDLYNPQLGYNLGYILYTVGKKDQALKAFSQFVDKIPFYKTKYNDIISAGYAYLGELQADKGELKNALTSLNNSIHYQPNQQAYLQMGDINATIKDFPKAIEAYEKGISFEPNRLSNIKRYYQLGFCYIMNKDLNNALQTFNRCIECSSYNEELIQKALFSSGEKAQEYIYYPVMSQLELGRLNSHFGNAEESLKHFNMAYSFSKNLLEYGDYYNMAYNYLQLRDDAKAIATIDSALVIYDNNPELLFLKTQIQPEKYEDNITLLDLILQQESTYIPKTFSYATVYHNISLSYFQLGEIRKALPYSEKAVKMGPEDPNNYATLGKIYFSLGNYKDCISAMSSCLDINPYDVNTLQIRGEAYLKIGMNEEGQKDLREALNEVIEYPTIQSNTLEDETNFTQTEIPVVVLSRDYTLVEMLLKNYAWCNINSKTSIVVNGKKYKMTRAEGIALSPQKTYPANQGDDIICKLFFPPIPHDAKTFDLIESKDSRWKFYGITVR